MSQSEVSKTNFWLTLLGSLGAFVIFALILFVAYLPNRPEPVDAQIAADRQAKADEARAAGVKKIKGYAVQNAEAGVVRIPLESAMDLTVRNYNSNAGGGKAE